MARGVICRQRWSGCLAVAGTAAAVVTMALTVAVVTDAGAVDTRRVVNGWASQRAPTAARAAAAATKSAAGAPSAKPTAQPTSAAEMASATFELERAAQEIARGLAELNRARIEYGRAVMERGNAGAESSEAAAEHARALAERTAAEAEAVKRGATATAASVAEAPLPLLQGKGAAPSLTPDEKRQLDELEATAASVAALAAAGWEDDGVQAGVGTAREERALAEIRRADAEAGRAAAAMVRALAEAARGMAEAARGKAAQARGQAEDARAAAEKMRAEAHSLRQAVVAEARRVTVAVMVKKGKGASNKPVATKVAMTPAPGKGKAPPKK